MSILAVEALSKRIYFLTAEDFQQPSFILVPMDSPLIAAAVAAPMRNECQEWLFDSQPKCVAVLKIALNGKIANLLPIIWASKVWPISVAQLTYTTN